jgi:hypothetical protein
MAPDIRREMSDVSNEPYPANHSPSPMEHRKKKHWKHECIITNKTKKRKETNFNLVQITPSSQSTFSFSASKPSSRR